MSRLFKPWKKYHKFVTEDKNVSGIIEWNLHKLKKFKISTVKSKSIQNLLAIDNLNKEYNKISNKNLDKNKKKLILKNKKKDYSEFSKKLEYARPILFDLNSFLFFKLFL